MLSIIICSVNPHFLSAVSKNIDETIGLTYELLPFDNRNQNLGICEVYNNQALLAKFDFLLFLHEDVLFETQNWGQELIDTFKLKDNCGVIGVAGSNYKSRMFSGWYSHIPELDACNIIHRKGEEELNLVHHRPERSIIYEVICIDGVFMASTKEAWLKTRFNQDKLKDFHFYDLDFSIRASFNFKILVTMNININHITVGGNFGDKWIEQAFIFHEYMNGLLPHPKTLTPNKKLELIIAKTWLDRLKIEKINLINKIKWITRQRLLSYPYLYYEIVKFLIYYPLRLKYLHRFVKKLRVKNKN